MFFVCVIREVAILAGVVPSIKTMKAENCQGDWRQSGIVVHGNLVKVFVMSKRHVQIMNTTIRLVNAVTTRIKTRVLSVRIQRKELGVNYLRGRRTTNGKGVTNYVPLRQATKLFQGQNFAQIVG